MAADMCGAAMMMARWGVLFTMAARGLPLTTGQGQPVSAMEK